MQIGNKPKYVSSQPSTFMKGIEVELAEKKIKDAKDARERSITELEEDADDQGSKEE